MKVQLVKAVGHRVGRIVVVGLALSAAVMIARILADTGVRVPYIALLPALVVCCDVYGLRVALWMTAASSIVAWYVFVEPIMSLGLPSLSDAVQLLCFVAVAAFVCWVLSVYRAEILRLDKGEPN